jgi:hypothetical protein
MRVFLTGGTGYIGSAVLDALVRAGHHVDALVRNRDKAVDVQVRGAYPVLGDLAQPETYGGGGGADGAIHAAMDDSPRGLVRRGRARQLLGLPPRSGRFFIYTSGVWVLGPAPVPVGKPRPSIRSKSAWRAPHEQRVLLPQRRTRTVVVRRHRLRRLRGIVGDLLRLPRTVSSA